MRKRRVELGLSQEEVANMADMARAVYSHIEVGRNKNPSIAQMESIAKALKVKPDINFFRDFCDEMEQTS
ncbi:MAG TPA: XRE family transcriptional regulator [Pelotomaculum sp.]|nr:XRE family transcriptional regulator [Pelotomaculum sp.]